MCLYGLLEREIAEIIKDTIRNAVVVSMMKMYFKGLFWYLPGPSLQTWVVFIFALRSNAWIVSNEINSSTGTTTKSPLLLRLLGIRYLRSS